jgi:hypothetical protein
MGDAALYRQIVDVLLAEHEKSTPPQPPDADTARKLTVTWGLYCQVHRLGRSATMLADHAMDQEGLVLIRVMLEHTITLHWVVERGDDGIDTMYANQSKQMARTFERARGTAMEVPEAIAREITATFDGIDSTKAASNFSNICKEVGCSDLYWVYGILSQSVHPSVSTGNAYIEPGSGTLQLTPRLGYPDSVQMIAHCLIWSQQALDRVVPDPARAQGLEKLASAIGAVPVLPAYRPSAPPAQRDSGGPRMSRAGRPVPSAGS